MVEKSAYSLDSMTMISKQDMIIQLQNLGIQKGMLLLVNVDSTKLGYLIGGAQTLIDALMEVVGYEGTIVMPSFTPQLQDPSNASTKLPRQYWTEIREHAYPFDKKLSEPFGSDEVVYQFLRNDAVARSYHPLYSFAAWGKYAKLICDKHPLHFALGKDSPLGKLVELNGYCVVLGCGYEGCTMFHMAQYQQDLSPVRLVCAPIENGKHLEWKNLLEVDHTTRDFLGVGEVMEDKKVVKTTYLGNGKCYFFSAREAYNLANSYFHVHQD